MILCHRFWIDERFFAFWEDEGNSLRRPLSTPKHPHITSKYEHAAYVWGLHQRACGVAVAEWLMLFGWGWVER